MKPYQTTQISPTSYANSNKIEKVLLSLWANTKSLQSFMHMEYHNNNEALWFSIFAFPKYRTNIKHKKY
uniref:Uncharacterized protein n=1 Tax=Pararge aegeria TaxID=116150 RepID=S4NTQ1_9NEOP